MEKQEYKVTRWLKLRGLSILHILMLKGDIAFLQWRKKVVAVLVPVKDEVEANGIKEVLERGRSPGGH